MMMPAKMNHHLRENKPECERIFFRRDWSRSETMMSTAFAELNRPARLTLASG
jgi:hypothetical protein